MLIVDPTLKITIIQNKDGSFSIESSGKTTLSTIRTALYWALTRVNDELTISIIKSFVEAEKNAKTIEK